MTNTIPTLDAPVVLDVVEHRIDGGDVAILTLRRPDGGDLPAWEPGSHIALRAGADRIREYSLCGDPSDTGSWQIAVRRVGDGRGGSVHVHDHLLEGAVAEVVRLGNLFAFDPKERPLFIAGGIGITPILPMITEADRLGLDWRLLYLGKCRDRMPFLDRLEVYGDRVQVAQSETDGRVNLSAAIESDPAVHVYSCGPDALLDELSAVCADSVALTVERFTPRKQDQSTDIPFDVVIASTDERVHVPCGVSTLDALLGAGVRVMNSCGEGTCGSCETPILEGRADHRDSILTDEERNENEFMYVCVSRSLTSTLTLEL
ncbi:MAG: PDR/VanB family oxidoreductase [Rhodococcus erythropolis]